MSGFIPRNISDFLSTQTLQRHYTFDLIANYHIRNLIEQACSTLLEGHLWVVNKCREKTHDMPGIVHWCCLSAGGVMAKCVQEPWGFFADEVPAERCGNHEESYFDLACPSMWRSLVGR